jgi:hypothetical protein
VALFLVAGVHAAEVKLTADDGAPGDQFGFSVAIDGDYAIVGADADDFGTGSAYIFFWNGVGWEQQQKLTASDGAPGDQFGYSVAIAGEYAIVGASAPWKSGTGSAYIFKREGTSWTEQQKLTASDGASGDGFGYSVAIAGEYAFAGAAGDDSGTGSAYIFKRDGTSWTQQQKLTASDGVAADAFGFSVSIDGDYAFAGAAGDDSGTGSAYLFKRDGTSWTQQAKLTASDGAADDHFGFSVAVAGDYAIVGAEWDDDKGADSGSAYVCDILGEDPSIPEFSTIAIPIAALLGLVFLFSRRRGREE